jgi:hypothetical protein
VELTKYRLVKRNWELTVYITHILTEAIKDDASIGAREEGQWSAKRTRISPMLLTSTIIVTYCMTAFSSFSCNPDAETGTMTIIIHLKYCQYEL